MESIRIYCENSSSYIDVPMGKTLQELAAEVCPELRAKSGYPLPVLAALVDNKLKSLDYKIINPHNVRFVGYDHPDGRRTYIRSLCFVLQAVVRKMFPDKILAIDYSLPSGLYCEIREMEALEDGRPNVFFATDEQLECIAAEMHAMIAADLPFTKKMMTLEECEKLFSAAESEKKRMGDEYLSTEHLMLAFFEISNKTIPVSISHSFFTSISIK